MPISKMGVNTYLGNCKYSHTRQFVFTGSNSTNQNKANNNKIKSRAVENVCGCATTIEQQQQEAATFGNTQELRIAVNLWISNKNAAKLQYGEINTWNTSYITDMSYLFENATSFNDNISSWDVSKVNDMNYMFFNAVEFNQDISNWEVGNVMTMVGMFFRSQFFNHNISGWNTSKVTNMQIMFKEAPNFNQDITGWNVSSVISNGFDDMFLGAAAMDTNRGAPPTPSTWFTLQQS